ncbi:hypothetical protein TUBRATIS_20840 [Tubulinosema ratisbonensis]|uniref:Major facilitator superfamily associated domain-containing protein n=1 Tax=Tubulinosema ratisbonensis TaxID=291195 RepID=A0A437AK09_9MICR|nr:hypothetical protein TUBRATIS_20840 [Tubulinosema ratisbonensis]
MKYVLFLVFLGNLFTYAAIYSVHNYISQILKSQTKLPNRSIALLNAYDISRLVTAYFFGTIGDKFRIRYLVGLTSLSFYVLTMRYITYYIKESSLNFKTVFIDFTLKAFNSGVIPMVEVMTVNMATIHKSKWCYSILRLSLIFGRTLGHFVPKKYLGDNDVSRYKSLLYFSCCAVPMLLLLHFCTRDIEEKREEQKKVSLIINLREIVFSQYFLILLFAVLQGIHRTSTSSFQTIYTRMVSKTKNESYVYIFRTLPELAADLICPIIEKRYGCINLVYIGAGFGISKALIYSFLTEKTVFLFYVAEIPKAFFSCFLCYGVTRLTKHYNSMERIATAQALYNGLFNGVAPCVAGMIGYILLRDETAESLKFLFLVTAFVGISGYIFAFFIKNKKI